MDITVDPDGTVEWNGSTMACALGANGVTGDKREGDQATPTGCYSLRRVYYRPDRVEPPTTILPTVAIDPLDGWCDAPDDPGYNTLVRQPYCASFELMWRDDHLYDVVVTVGHNDDPVVAGMGSAIFMHVARPDFGPTQGCVAVTRENLLRILAECDETTRLCVNTIGH
jgi:L,D-peptidoglycan transpeptidase YkuD (ErfK/YbiS/YcfS/YnhG family)